MYKRLSVVCTLRLMLWFCIDNIKVYPSKYYTRNNKGTYTSLGIDSTTSDTVEHNEHMRYPNNAEVVLLVDIT